MQGTICGGILGDFQLRYSRPGSVFWDARMHRPSGFISRRSTQGPGGWYSNRQDPLRVWDGNAYCYSPWWLDANHAPRAPVISTCSCGSIPINTDVKAMMTIHGSCHTRDPALQSNGTGGTSRMHALVSGCEGMWILRFANGFPYTNTDG